jgi:hypothetical protein
MNRPREAEKACFYTVWDKTGSTLDGLVLRSREHTIRQASHGAEAAERREACHQIRKPHQTIPEFSETTAVKRIIPVWALSVVIRFLGFDWFLPVVNSVFRVSMERESGTNRKQLFWCRDATFYQPLSISQCSDRPM